MAIRRYIARASFAGVATMALTGVAAAADSAAIDSTGQGSTNNITISNVQSDTTTNTNVVNVSNANVQVATSGEVNANNNTTAGDVGSGTASNSAAQATVVTINNPETGGMGNGSPGDDTGGQGNGGGVTPGGQGGSDVSGAGGSGNGSVLGASTGGMGAGSGDLATLPSVGASVPMDVSALRALYEPANEAPTTDFAKKASGISTGFLALASVMSLIGAAVTGWRARRARLKV